MTRAFVHSSSRFRRTAGVMLAVCFVWAAAIAGPPFLTDDPEPVELHHWEFYAATQTALTRDDTSGTAPHFEINYGAFPDTQLHLISPFVYDNPSGRDNMHYGYGDMELGVKYRFIHETDQMPQVGIFPLAEIPTGNSDKGLGNGQAQYFLPVWAQKSWGKWTTYGGGGYWINPGPGNKDYWFTGWLLQRQLTDQFACGGEIFYATPSEDGGSKRIGINIGGLYDFTDNYHLLFSIGRDIKGDNLLISYLAIQLTF